MDRFAASLPDFGDPSFPAVCAATGAFVGAWLSRRSGAEWDEVETSAFKSAYYGTAGATIIYLGGLITGLY